MRLDKRPFVIMTFGQNEWPKQAFGHYDFLLRCHLVNITFSHITSEQKDFWSK